MCKPLAVLIALTSVARAGNDVVKVGDYELVRDTSTIVRKGKRSAPISSSPFVAVDVDRKAKRIVLELRDGCSHTDIQIVGFDELEARLVNYDAMKRHLAKDYKRAVEGFAAAVKADPTWCIAAYNLASAHVKLGQNDLAIDALKACFVSNPIFTYVQILRDPELQPLAGTPEVAALRAKKPGTLQVDAHSQVGVGYARDADVVAYLVEHPGWLADGGSEIELRTGKTGVLITTLPLREAVGTEDMMGGDARKQKQLDARDAERRKLANKVLADMGFEPITGERAEFAATGDKVKAYLPGAKLGLVEASDGTVHVLRGNTIVGRARERAQSATYYADASVMILSSRMGPRSEDSCQNHDELVPVASGSGASTRP